jgi:PAS domain S-box-containing protein
VRDELTTSVARLQDSEHLYRLLADNQTDLISLWSGDGRNRLYASPSAERAFGFTAEEMMALPGSANAHPDDMPIITGLTDTLEHGGPAKSAEYRLHHRDGSLMWVEGTWRRLADGDFLSTTRIINERKALQIELERALEDARAALTVKSDFLANMTHELRTPLNAIVGFSGLLKASPTLHENDRRGAELISDASQTLLSVVNDVLDFSKLEAGAVEMEAHPFGATELAETTALLLSGQAEAKGLSIRVETCGARDLLVGDSARLRQVLLNFLSNAVKFTTRGEIVVAVRQSPVETGPALRRLRVSVADQGIGVPPEQQQTIFDRFTQSDASVSRRFGGTGLGLAISKRIIRAQGGDIGVDSTPGVGSTFWFEVEMPLAAIVDAETAGEGSVALDIEQALRILVVDDNAVNRELVGAFLAPFDIEIATARDGVEAVEMALAGAYDLILMDVQMPNMDGMTATRRIRAQTPSGAPRVPIIAMTANVLDDQVRRCLEAGMDDHLGKPLDPAKLLETLSRWSAPQDETEVAEVA